MDQICQHCGARLPEDAAFCPHCATSQIEKRPLRAPQGHRILRRVLPVFGAVLVLAAILAVREFVFHPIKPRTGPVSAEDRAPLPAEAAPAAQTYDSGGAELLYPAADGGTYHVLLTFNGGTAISRTPVFEVSSQIPAGAQYAYPSQLYIYRDDTQDDVQQEFLSGLSSLTVETVPQDGAEQMTWSEPRWDAGFPAAARMTDIFYTAACGINDILWTLTMKNGDVLRLRQRITVTQIPTVRYSSADAPLDTDADLQALLDRAAQEAGPDTVVEIELPPVTYTGELTFTNRAYTLIGTSDGTACTTFTAPLHIRSQEPHYASLQGITFAGQGGIGLDASAGVHLQDCTFTGWDTAAFAGNGAWFSINGCTFEDNGTALEWNSAHSRLSGDGFYGNVFRGNGAAIRLLRLGAPTVLHFDTCIFENNGTDLENHTGNEVVLPGSAQTS